jgi:hypothetical protein
MTPTASATTRPNSTTAPFDLNILDDFSENVNGWPTLNNEWDGYSTQDLNLQNGELFWHINCSNGDGCYYYYFPDTPSLSDFDVSVDIKRTIHPANGGFFGIVFRFQDDQNYYLFAVDDSSQNFLVWSNQHNWTTMHVEWTYKGVIRNSGVNRLAVSARGTTFTFYINDTKVATTEIIGISSGNIGIVAQVDGAEDMSMIYDNFELLGTTK